MAGAGDDNDDAVEGAHQPRECMACRGSGSVISNLGGTPSTVTCPWCRGAGTRIADIDAQAAWAERDADAGAAGGAETEGAAPGSAQPPAGDGGDSAA